MFFTEVLSWIY